MPLYVRHTSMVNRVMPFNKHFSTLSVMTSRAVVTVHCHCWLENYF